MTKRTRTILGILAAIAVTATFYFHDEPWLFHVGTGIFALVGVIVTTFVIIYGQRNWRANAYGRALMYSMASLALVVLISLVTTFLGRDWEWRAAVRVILFGGIFITQGRLLYLLFLAKPNKRDEYQSR